MNRRLLDILECPYCGGPLDLLENPCTVIRDAEVVAGMLGCACCAYPVVDGIPYLQTGPAAARAMALLAKGDAAEALFMLLGLAADDDRRRRFERLLPDAAGFTFRAALDVLSRDAEGAYLLYRFSDPTFLAGDALLRALGPTGGRTLDLCGGAGHLTRTLCGLAPAGDEVVVADIAYWKLWLAKRFVAQASQPVCCDASHPLPFARASFDLVCCSDAFHYVWPRRLLAGEMMRAAAADGTIVLPHLHNAACDNPSAGMPLTAGGYRRVFAERRPRLFGERAVFEAVLAGEPIDPGPAASDGQLDAEPNLILICTARADVFRRHAMGADNRVTTINPLYHPVAGGADDVEVLDLRFPSDFYAEEFAAARRYLPDRVEIPTGARARWAAGGMDELRRRLTEQRVLLDLPERYT